MSCAAVTTSDNEAPQPPPRHCSNLSPTSSRSPSFSSNSTNNENVSAENNLKTSIKREANEEYNIPIAGYEIVEERARFTAFKVNVICLKTSRSWIVFRRYSDFSRLRKKLKNLFPCFQFDLPSKRWFGNNFDPSFLENRVLGLQIFINQIMRCKQVYVSSHVRKFFCFDDPSPQVTDISIQSNWNSLEKYIDQLQQSLKEKDDEINSLKQEVITLKNELHHVSKSQNSVAQEDKKE